MPIINQIVKGSGGSGPVGLYREFQLDANGVLQPNTTTTHIMDFTGMTDVSDYALTRAYYDNTAIYGAVDMSDLTTISGNYACSYMFYGCTGLTSADISALTTVSVSNAFSLAFAYSGITSVDLSALTTISGSSAFSSAFAHSGITSVDLSALTTISGNNACYGMFSSIGITTISLPSLTTISGNASCSYMFENCTSLATVYIGGTTAIDFGTRTNQFTAMFSGCTQNIDVYAPAANQAAIEAFSGYPNFGGTGTVTWHWRS